MADPINFVDPDGLIGMPAMEQPDGPSMGGPPDAGQCEPVYPELALAPFLPGAKNVLNRRLIFNGSSPALSQPTTPPPNESNPHDTAKPWRNWTLSGNCSQRWP